MVIFKGTKPECVREMLTLEAIHGRHFWVVSMDDCNGTYVLECSVLVAHLFTK